MVVEITVVGFFLVVIAVSSLANFNNPKTKRK
jgi:hypothetical protein